MTVEQASELLKSLIDKDSSIADLAFCFRASNDEIYEVTSIEVLDSIDNIELIGDGDDLSCPIVLIADYK